MARSINEVHTHTITVYQYQLLKGEWLTALSLLNFFWLWQILCEKNSNFFIMDSKCTRNLCRRSSSRWAWIGLLILVSSVLFVSLIYVCGRNKSNGIVCVKSDCANNTHASSGKKLNIYYFEYINLCLIEKIRLLHYLNNLLLIMHLICIIDVIYKFR